MPELSNSVRHRLGARPAPQTHPDADILTAYVEQLLPSGERNQIQEHLADCSFCREVVSLSLPALPEKTAVHTLPAPSKFWKFGFRWAGALAVVSIAVALVVYRPGNKDLGRGPVAKVRETPVTEASVPKTTDTATAEKFSVTTAEPSTTRSTQPSNAPPSSASPTTAPLATNGRVSGGPGTVVSGLTTNVQQPSGLRREAVARNEAQNSDLKDSLNLSSNRGVALGAVLESNPRPRPAPQNQEYVNSAFFSAAEHSNAFDYKPSYRDARQEQARVDADREKKRSTLTLATPPEQDTNTRKGFLKKALPIGPLAASVIGTLKAAAAGPSAASDALANEKTSASSFAPAPARPPISAKAVTSTAAAITHEGTELRRTKAASADQLHWRVQDGKLVNSDDLNQWHEAYPSQSDEVQFKVVQAQGHEIWAGGTNATLVHSWNGGVDWQKLNLGDAASGDIEKISVSGGDVQVKTSNGQHLISRDGGKTWTPLNAEGNPTQPNQPK